jgi:hypothetical protein
MASHPEITVEPRWGNPTWLVNGRQFCWHRAFSKADLRRFADAGEAPPDGDVVAIMVSGLDEKDAILFASPPGFFTISHFNGYPAVLVALASARQADVMPVLERMRQHLLSLPAKRAKTSTQKASTKKEASPKKKASPTKKKASPPKKKAPKKKASPKT